MPKLSAWNLNAYLIAFKVGATDTLPWFKASLTGGKSLEKKKNLTGKDQECIIAKEQVVVLLKKASYALRPSLHQPPRIMLLCWCHIDYADCKLPLFVPSSPLSLIHRQRGAEVTLKAIFSMFFFFLHFQVTL